MRTGRTSAPASGVTMIVALALFSALGAASRAQPLNGTVEQHSFTGPVSGRNILYSIYLPAGYSTSTQRYPVVFHLHGIGGNQGGGQTTQVPGSFETALAACRIGPVIVVFPNGYVDNFWADSFDGTEPAETNVVPELVAHVDAGYRTIPGRSNRVIEGFSMGGFGAMKFFSKFPDLFVCAVEYDGALVTWNDVVAFHPTVASSVFNNSQSAFDVYSPWAWSTANAPVLRAQTGIRMIAGALAGGNKRFRDFLTSLSIPFQYVESGCDHNLVCLLNAEGQNSASFIAARLTPFVANVRACRAGSAVLSAHGAGKAPFGYRWQIADPAAVGGWRPLSDGPLVIGAGVVATLSGTSAQNMSVDLSGHGIALVEATFRCEVTSVCGGGFSNGASFRVCLADFNCDGFATGDDFDEFMAGFDLGSASADFDANGFTNGDDFDAFTAAFDRGC